MYVPPNIEEKLEHIAVELTVCRGKTTTKGAVLKALLEKSLEDYGKKWDASWLAEGFESQN